MSVKVAGKMSCLKEITSSVQDTVLGPVLFLTLIALQTLLNVDGKLLLIILNHISVFLKVLVFQYCNDTITE